MAAKKVKSEVKLVKCIECEYSDCSRYWNDPVISACRVRKSFGKPYKQVANSTHQCAFFKRFSGIVKPVSQS